MKRGQQSELTERRRAIIVQLYSVEGLTQTEIAERLGLSPNRISSLCSQFNIKPRYNPYRNNGRKPKLTMRQRKEARLLRKQGWTMRELAARYGCSISMIFNTVNYQLRADDEADDRHKA